MTPYPITAYMQTPNTHHWPLYNKRRNLFIITPFKWKIFSSQKRFYLSTIIIESQVLLKNSEPTISPPPLARSMMVWWHGGGGTWNFTFIYVVGTTIIKSRAYFKRFSLGDSGAPRFFLSGGEGRKFWVGRDETTVGSGGNGIPPCEKGGPGVLPRENFA